MKLALGLSDWRSLDIHEWRDWPASAQRVLIAAVAISALVLVGLLFAWPMWRELRDAHSQGQQLQTAAQAQSAAASDWPNLRAQLARAQIQWQDLQQRIPRELRVQQALETLDALAQEHRIDMQAVRVRGVQSLPTHRAQAIEIEARGDYHDWGRWMASLLDSKPLMWVSALEAQAAGARGVTVHVKMTVICVAQPDTKGLAR